MISLHQSSSQKQSTTVTQSMVQACSILSMSLEELREYIQNAALENPLISFESVAHASPYGDSLRFRGFTESVIDLSVQTDASKNFFEKPSDLCSHLIMQLPKQLTDQQRKAFYYIINSLDDSGFFRESEVSAAGKLGLDPEIVHETLELVRSMDPPGIGAADLRHCYLIQLKKMRPLPELAIGILEEEYDSLCRNRLKDISRRFGCSIGDIYSVIDLLRSLESRPSQIYDCEISRYIIPDVTISSWEDDFRITLNKDATPEIKLDEAYSCIGFGDADAQLWLAEKKKQASAIQHFVRKRNSTLLMVCTEIFQYQKTFFFKGPKYLCKLKQKDIADTLGCHESTVFRAVNGKYLSCSWGTFPLSYFFSNTIDCEDDGFPCNPRDGIRSIIDGEDKTAPLSDGKIALLMADRGFKISRRTVAKYREEEGIPAGSLRKKY